MKLVFFITFCSFLLCGCKNVKIITDNEDKGVKDVLEFFGGYCEYSIGASFSTSEGSAKYFELKESKSEVLEKFSNTPDAMASNMAYLFYKDLNGESKNYNEIHSVLIFNKKNKYEAIYTTEQLALITEKMKVLNKVLDLIKAKDFIGLKPILSDDSYTQDAKNQLITNLQKIDSTFGNVKGFMPFGFRYETLNGFNLLDIFGVITRDKQDNEFTLKVNLKVSDDKVHFLDYKLFQ